MRTVCDNLHSHDVIEKQGLYVLYTVYSSVYSSVYSTMNENGTTC